MVCNDYLCKISTRDEYYLQYLSMEKTPMLTVDSKNFTNIILQCTLTLHWVKWFVLLQYHINSTKIVKHKAVFRLVLYDMLETFKICSSNSSTYQGCSPSSWDQNSWVLPSEFTSLERAFCNQAVHHSFIALVKRWLLFRDRVTESHQATETHKSGINSLLQSASYSRSTAILGHAYFIWATIDQWKHLM